MIYHKMRENKDIVKSIIIGLAGVGAVILVGAVAPNLFKIFNKKKIFKNTYNKNKFSKTVYYLKRKKFINIKDNPDNTCTVELTEGGIKKLLKYDIDNIKIKPMEKWDGKWRFVMFDIPDKRRKASNALREKLKELGFLQFQKSIWVYPYPIGNEIEFIAEVFNIRQFIKMGEIVNLDNEDELRSEFKLL